MPSPVWVGIIHSLADLNRTNRKEDEFAFSVSAEMSISPPLRQCSWFLGFQTLSGNYTIALILRPSDRN